MVIDIEAAKEWLQREEKSPLSSRDRKRWRWVPFNPAAPKVPHALPIAVYDRLTDGQGIPGETRFYPTRERAIEAAVDAVARAQGLGWEPDKGD